MVVNNLPPIAKLPKNQCEFSSRILPLRHSQMPGPSHERPLRPQHLNPQIGKIQLPHGVTRTVIRRAISLVRSLPPASLFCSREECEIRRIPIPRHEAIEIMPIPRLLLRRQDMLDRGFGIGSIGVWDERAET